MGIPTPAVQKQFFDTFKKPVNFFWNIAGFDVVKFDEWLKTPDEKSTAQFVEERYGKDAVELVKNLF